MLVGVVVDLVALGREAPPPEILIVPVREGEIDARPYALGPIGIQHLLGDVGPGIRMEGTLFGSDLVIGLVRVEHAEPVVVLGREYHVLHPGVSGCRRPFGRIEGDGIEGRLQRLILVPVFEIIHVTAGLVLPFDVFRTERPGFDDAPLAISAPVDEHSEFQVLPFGQARLDFRLSRRDILRGSRQAQQGGKQGKETLFHIR